MKHAELFADPLFQLFCRLSRFSPAGIGGPMGAAIRHDSIRHYCAEYLKEHQRLPDGRHRVPMRWKNSNGSFDCRFPAEDLSRCLSVAFTEEDAGLHELGKWATVIRACEDDELRAIEVSHRWVAGAKPTICSVPGHHPEAAKAAKTVLILLRRIPLSTVDAIGLDSVEDTPLISLTLKFARTNFAIQTKEWAPPGDWLHWYVDWGSGSTPLSSPIRHVFLKIAARVARVCS